MSRLSRPVSPVLLAVAASLLISIVSLLTPDPINNDGVLYLRAAAAWLNGGFGAATQVYSWPFYSVVIAIVSKTGLSLLQSAQLVNVVLMAMLSAAYVAAVTRLWPARVKLHYWAIPAVLLLPELVELRHEVVRDTGYLAFLLLSLPFFLNFAARPRLIAACGWLATVGLAMLFRLEALLVGVAGALVLTASSSHRKEGVALLGFYLALVFVALAGLQLYAPESRVGELAEWWRFLTQEFLVGFRRVAEQLESHVLNHYSAKYSRESAAAILIIMLVWTTVKGITAVHALSLWYGRRGVGVGLAPAGQRALVAYGVAVALPPLLFGLKHFFLTQRYVLGIVLILLLLVPATWSALLVRIASRRWRMVVVGLLVFLFAAAGVRKTVGMADAAMEAGDSLAAGTGTLWTNSTRLAFYADPEFERSVLIDWAPGWRDRLPAAGEVDELAVVVEADELRSTLALFEQAGYVEVTRFPSTEATVLLLTAEERARSRGAARP